MWDNPRLLNAAAGFLVGITLLACTLVGLQMLVHSSLWPVREVVVRGELQHTTRAEVEATLEGHVSGNFFSVELGEVRAAAERLPWVRRAGVRRVWPDRLEVTIEEHVALARWGERQLLNTFGERFAGKSDARLPRLAGPPGTEAEVARRYVAFSRTLAPLGTPLEQVVLTPRFAWQLRLGNGVQLALGRDADAAQARLERFVQTFGAQGAATRYDYVDLRYPNGFALRLREARS